MLLLKFKISKLKGILEISLSELKDKFSFHK